LLSDAESPLSEKSASSTEDFLSFASNNTTLKPNEVDYFLADKDIGRWSPSNDIGRWSISKYGDA
jgi:hypothetical protein